MDFSSVVTKCGPLTGLISFIVLLFCGCLHFRVFECEDSNRKLLQSLFCHTVWLSEPFWQTFTLTEKTLLYEKTRQNEIRVNRWNRQKQSAIIDLKRNNENGLCYVWSSSVATATVESTYCIQMTLQLGDYSSIFTSNLPFYLSFHLFVSASPLPPLRSIVEI